MKFHLLSYNIHELNAKGEIAKLRNYFRRLYFKVFYENTSYVVTKQLI